MRAAVLALAISAVAGNALAADYLRGSTYEAPVKRGYDWRGVYFGGQGGYANTDFIFGEATRPLVANELRSLLVEQESRVSELPNLPGRDARGASYGGFVGYNMMWDSVVLGLELNYNRTSIAAESNDFIGRRFSASNGLDYATRLDSRASAELTDYASLRFRAGYAMDWLMPYMMIGVAAGRANYSRSVLIDLVESNPATGVPTGGLLTVASDSRRNAIAAGVVAGAGVDVGLTHNIFLRAEYEYMHLFPVGGIAFNVNTIRGAAGIKF